jgi:hypothetical protein
MYLQNVFKKSISKKSLISIVIFVLLLFLVNSVLSSIIQRKISELLLKKNSKYYVANVEDVQFKLLRRTVILDNVFLSPTNESFAILKKEKSKKKALNKIHISSIELNGIHILKLLFYKNIKINNLKINNLLIQQFENKKIKKTKKGNLNLDSIYIKNLNGLQINKISVNNLVFQTIDASNDKISFQNKPVSFSLSGFKLKEHSENYFKLMPINNEIKIDKISIDFPEIKYHFSIDALSFDFKNKNIRIQNLIYKPLAKRSVMVNQYKFNKEIFDVKIGELNLFNFELQKFINKKGIYIDSISLVNLDMKLFKDKRKPFDLNKRPSLPHMALKQMKSDLLIHKINISNSNLYYEEHLEKKELLLKIALNQINTQILNITSIEKYRENPLKVKVKSMLNNQSAMTVDLLFPLKEGQDTFYFNGHLGPAEFKYFDSAIVPALGMKILKGSLDNLEFSATADINSSNGTMTMLYHNLEAEVFKSKTNEENKFLSWTVNHVVHKSNPGKNGKEREAILKFNRTIYKGVVNYIWKTIQIGLTSTIAPVGKTIKIKVTESKKELRREKRKEKNN